MSTFHQLKEKFGSHFTRDKSSDGGDPDDHDEKMHNIMHDTDSEDHKSFLQ
jgi:hypothetical protein